MYASDGLSIWENLNLKDVRIAHVCACNCDLLLHNAILANQISKTCSCTNLQMLLTRYFTRV